MCSKCQDIDYPVAGPWSCRSFEDQRRDHRVNRLEDFIGRLETLEQAIARLSSQAPAPVQSKSVYTPKAKAPSLFDE